MAEGDGVPTRSFPAGPEVPPELLASFTRRGPSLVDRLYAEGGLTPVRDTDRIGLHLGRSATVRR